MSKIAIIGSGFSGISAAAYLAAAGNEVHVFEKNSSFGGRARQFNTKSNYVFDMGPSWYWMPDVFDKFFSDFGFKTSDFYPLKLLAPAFEVVYGPNDSLLVPENFNDLCAVFESIESGSARRLRDFMKEAEYKYEQGIDNLAYKPGLSLTEFADIKLMKGAIRLQVFSSFARHVRKYFKHPKLISLMEFPVLFLGAMPKDTPALYSLMNYAGLRLGTWYPKGGFGRVIQSMIKVAQMYGASFHSNANVEQIVIENNLCHSLIVNGRYVKSDAVVATADYHHVESKLLPETYRNYRDKYWTKLTLAPSALIYYLGINKRIESLHHHTLFFDEDLNSHARDIYQSPKWPTKPLFYACCTSKSDDGVAPAGHENIFLLMPIAPGLEDSEVTRQHYLTLMLKRLEQHTHEPIESHIDFKQSFCVSDFISDYNAYKGNAYGLANTLSQTAILKPKIRNRKIPNLFYAGQLTVPGPGVPPAIISGKIAAGLVKNFLKKTRHEITI